MNVRWHYLAPALLAAAAGCDRPPAPAATAPAATAPAAGVVKPQRESLARVVQQPGAVQAYEETPLFAKLSGYVQTVRADIGQKVRGPRLDPSGKEVEPGEVLAEIAVPEMDEEAKKQEAVIRQGEAEVVQSRKSVATAGAGVEYAEASVAEAKAGVGRAQALHDRWASESKRIAGLVQSGVIDQQTRDETDNQFKAAGASRDEANARVATAQAGVRKANAERDRADADVRAAEARLEVARAEARRLEATLRYAKVRAPFDGIVTRRRVDTGHFIQPGGGKPEALFTVAVLDRVRVVVDVSEADAALVRDGAVAKIAVHALGGAEIAGKVTRTAWALEPGARTLRAEIDLPNPDGRLRPGMYVVARITADLPEAWVLPSAAVAKQGDALACYRAESSKWVRTPVQAGRTDGTQTQVFKMRKAGTADAWEDITGQEEIAAQAAAVSDGQPVQR